MSDRITTILETAKPALEQVAAGTTIRAAVQAGPDAVIVERHGLRGDRTPFITMEIRPDTQAPESVTSFGTVFSEEVNQG